MTLALASNLQDKIFNATFEACETKLMVLKSTQSCAPHIFVLELLHNEWHAVNIKSRTR